MATISFEGLTPWAAAALATAVCLLLAWRYRSSLRHLPHRRLAILSLLRAATVLGLVWAALLPTRTEQLVEPVPRRIAVLLDGSLSMELPAAENKGARTTNRQNGSTGKSRLAVAKELLGELEKLPLRLDLFSFSGEFVRGTKVKPGPTDLYGALETVESRSAGTPYAAILLLTDGRATDAPGRPISTPVYAVPLGPTENQDLAIACDALPSRVLPEETIRIDCRAFRSSQAMGEVMVELAGENENLRERRLKFETDEWKKSFSLDLTPKREGLLEVRVTIGPAEGGTQETRTDLKHDAPTSRDVVPLNDTIDLVTHAAPSKTRVLVLASRASEEAAFVARELERQADLEVVRAIQLPRDRILLADGTIRSAAEIKPLHRYAAIVITGAPAINTFSEELAETVRQGGGLLLMGDSDAPSRFLALRDLLPLDLRQATEKRGRFTASLGPRARNHPILKFLEDLPDSAYSPAALPPLEWTWARASPKPGTTVLMEAGEPADPWPLLSLERYGQGRVALVSGGPFWSWRFQPVGMGSGKEELFIRLLPRLLRWTAMSGEFDQYGLALREEGRILEVQVSELKEDLTPAVGNRVKLHLFRLERGGSRTLVQRTEVTLGSGGSAIWRPRIKGRGIFLLEATYADGSVTRQEVVAMGLPEGELNWTHADRQRLQALAHATGGRLLERAEVAAVLQEFSQSGSHRISIHKTPLWADPRLLALLLFLLCAEWALRKLWALP